MEILVAEPIFNYNNIIPGIVTIAIAGDYAISLL